MVLREKKKKVHKQGVGAELVETQWKRYIYELVLGWFIFGHSNYVIRDRTHQIISQLVLKNNENKILYENNIIVNCRKRTSSLIVGETMNKIYTTNSKTN